MKKITFETQVILFLVVVLPTVLTLYGVYFFEHQDSLVQQHARTDALEAKVQQLQAQLQSCR